MKSGWEQFYTKKKWLVPPLWVYLVSWLLETRDGKRGNQIGDDLFFGSISRISYWKERLPAPQGKVEKWLYKKIQSWVIRKVKDITYVREIARQGLHIEYQVAHENGRYSKAEWADICKSRGWDEKSK